LIKTDFLKKLSWIDFIFVIALVASTLVNIQALDFPKNLELHRDYLVSRHIVVYDEYPLTGASNQIFPALRSSPTYPYFWAGFLLLKDDLMFLGFVNVFLQSAGIVALYLLARKLFGKGTALITALLFSFSTAALFQSGEFWQPHTLQPFINISFLLLALAYFRKSLAFLWGGIFIFFFSASFHYSAYALLPILIAVTIFILKSQKRTLQEYVSTFGFSFFSLLFFYFPVLLFLKEGSFNVGELGISSLLIDSFGKYFVNLRENISLLINHFFIQISESDLKHVLAIGVTLLSFLFYYFIKNIPGEKKKYFSILLVSVSLPLIFAAFLDTVRWAYYFTPIFGVFIIVISEGLNRVFTGNLWLKASKVILVGFFLVVFSGNFTSLKQNSDNKNIADINEGVINALESDIRQIKDSENRQDFDYFKFWVYKEGSRFRDHDAFFWSGLEKGLGQKLVTLVDNGASYREENTDEHIYLICQFFTKVEGEQEFCTSVFLRENPDRILGEKLFEDFPYSVYKTSRDNSYVL